MVGALDTPANRAWAISIFPKLAETEFKITSPVDRRYNCIAWAAGEDQEFWWPGKGNWPPGVPATQTRIAFIKAFQTRGYDVCVDGDPEEGYEKVVLYEKLGRPEHAARSTFDGQWSSKLGQSYDIVHTLEGLSGTQYGKPALFMKRQIQFAALA